MSDQFLKLLLFVILFVSMNIAYWYFAFFFDKHIGILLRKAMDIWMFGLNKNE